MPTVGLAKARLIPLTGTRAARDPNKKPGDPESSAQGGFTVTFNPATLKVSYANTLEGSNARGAKVSQYIGKQSMELSMELVFDTTDVDPDTLDWGDTESRAKAKESANTQGDVDVRAFTSRIVALMAPIDTKNKDKPAPFRVQFVWGSFLFEGVMKSLTETLDLFSVDGIPLRATLALSLSEDALEFRTATPGQRAPSLATSSAGDTASQLASNNDLPPQAGKQLAAANGLDDLRSIPGGMALALPSVSASFGASAAMSIGASASASFGASASLSAGFSASASADLSGGFGGGAGIGVTIGGGGGFGLDIGASAGVSAGLSLSISGGVAGTGSASISLAGAGSVGGPSAGGAPGAQTTMDVSGRMALAPAAPPAPLAPPSSAPAGTSSTTRAAPPPPVTPASDGAAPVGALGTPSRVASAAPGSHVAGTIGLPASPAQSSLGLPVPLPPRARATGGAFSGIRGVPRKRGRFDVATAVTPLAYRRLPPDQTCLDQSGPEDCTALVIASAGCKRRACTKGCRNGCRH